MISVMTLSTWERGLVSFADWMSGTKTNTVVLSREKLTIGPAGEEFSVANEAQVVGDFAVACLALRGNFSSQERDGMDAEYERLLNGVTPQVQIETLDGRSLKFSRWGESWSMVGKIFARDELASCAHIDCSEADLEPGTDIQKIIITAPHELEVGGAYWESTNRWDSVDQQTC